MGLRLQGTLQHLRKLAQQEPHLLQLNSDLFDRLPRLGLFGE
jgi:hypothetical protein